MLESGNLMSHSVDIAPHKRATVKVADKEAVELLFSFKAP